MFVNPYIKVNMIRKFILIVLLIGSVFSVKAQYTEVINSNQPGFSESPYGVGKNVYQFESSLFYRKADASETFSNPKAVGLNLQFRTSFFDEKLEFNLTTALQNNTFAFKNVFESSETRFTLSQLTLAAKYLVFVPNYKKKEKEIRSWNKRHAFSWDRWVPHIAAYGGFNFGSILDDFNGRGGITPKIGVLLQNELSNQLNVITNFYYNYIGGRLPEFSYILTATYNFNKQWSGFAEHQALFNKQEKQSNLGLGVAYLMSNDLQLNGALKATFQAENNIGVYFGVGASYRIDRHVDEFIELDEYGNRVDPLTKETYNKGFFGKILDKIKGFFKKKDKKDVPVDEDLAKPDTDTEIEKEEGRGRKRQKSILGTITKEDKKDKKETVKEEKKLTKKQIKAKEKLAKDIEKEKLKEAKELEKQALEEAKALRREQEELAKEEARLQRELDKEAEAQRKEEEKLENEIKKLEEDIAKEEAKLKQEELDRKYKEELDRKKKEQKE